ncbi:hypothetical protein NSB25_26980 [Acetatifactor muris]|uniref:Uncharacterized protein n=1 Tax=Acetatifactor muris TaxID=879566 RepID=A0A2K4ZPJ4_9FIRM|nr:hypothetical protein [Acetatifactor muris]MCR2050876.1 hypothetical protein [Acetatifactor muris]SOY32401.1 hypothetical protein AMURIS_05160 [Acetatifactor muris]
MKKAVLWGKEIKQDFTSASESQLDAFLDLVQFIQQNDIWNAICESTLDEAELWGWLYSKEQIELNDIKRELARRMERAKCVSQEEFDKLLGEIGKIQKIMILVLSFQRVCVYYISTILAYYTGIRSYLALEKKDDFCNDLQECFPNIYFVEGVRTTVNTLNRRFEDIREEIVEHLTWLNDYRVKFGELLDEHKSFQEIAQQFSADTGIDCSPQVGRDKVQALKESRRNEATGQEETIICELHTKFKTFNVNRERQDRIYFFPGKRDILGGKVIVKHIGKHL